MGNCESRTKLDNGNFTYYTGGADFDNIYHSAEFLGSNKIFDISSIFIRINLNIYNSLLEPLEVSLDYNGRWCKLSQYNIMYQILSVIREFLDKTPYDLDELFFRPEPIQVIKMTHNKASYLHKRPHYSFPSKIENIPYEYKYQTTINLLAKAE